MDKFCHSCAAPLGMPEFKGPAENYCKYCTNETGELKTREEIQKGIADWFQSWQPGLDEQKALQRAADYMKAMPVWVQE
jgi:hypothetical protein